MHQTDWRQTFANATISKTKERKDWDEKSLKDWLQKYKREKQHIRENEDEEQAIANYFRCSQNYSHHQ